MLGNAHANDASWGESIAGSASGSKPVHTSSFVYTPTPPDAEGASAAVGVVVTSGTLQVDTHGAIVGTGSLLSLAEYTATLVGCSGSCGASATCSQTSDPSAGAIKFLGLEFTMSFGASGTAVPPGTDSASIAGVPQDCDAVTRVITAKEIDYAFANGWWYSVADVTCDSSGHANSHLILSDRLR
jgi:hypothetical protein